MKTFFLSRNRFRDISLIMSLMFMLTSTSLIAQPQVTGNHSKERLVTNKSWSRVGNLSSEWNSFNNNNWTKVPVEGRWTWEGRFPGLFEEDNVSVFNGQLRIEAEKFATPKRAAGWTHGGGVVRSRAKVRKGMYVEARMKTTETIMSGTFWLINPPGSCPRVEVDITESVGVTSNRVRFVGRQFSTGMNSNVHGRGGCVTDDRSPERSDNFNPDAAFHTYGLYWESETQLHFYHNGRFMWTITPPSNASDDMHIMLVVETYDHNLPSTGANGATIDGFNKPKWRRLTRYDWVRTWNENGNKNIGSVGFENTGATSILNIFPNPADDYISINGLSDASNVSVFDLDGKKVLSASNSEKIDVSGLNKGIYMVILDGVQEPIKLIKK